MTENPYGQQPSYPGGPAAAPADHPQATLILILGILSLVLCQGIGPFAWVMGKRAMGEIDASGGRIGGRGMVQAGMITGIIATVILIVSIVALIAFFVFAIGILGAASTT